MRNTILTQQVNFIVSVVFMGSAALLGMVLMIEASDEHNPVASLIAASVYADAE
jgi:hypothetical protein